MRWTQQDADMAQKFAGYMTTAKYELTGAQVIDMFACIKWFNLICEQISADVLGEKEPKKKDEPAEMVYEPIKEPEEEVEAVAEPE